MTVERNRAAVERLLAAVRDRDEEAFAAAYADDAVVRQSGVPASMGGVLEGKAAIVENFRRQDPWAVDVRLLFGDDAHVCVDPLTGHGDCLLRASGGESNSA